MDNAEVKGDWLQFVERAKEKWGQLTNDDWKLIEGKRDQLLANIPGLATRAPAGSTGRSAGSRKERLVGEHDGA
jgi:hypothetical protein